MGSMRIMIITSTVVFPIVSSLLLGVFFGVYGVLLCYTLSDLLSLVSIWLYYVIGIIPLRTFLFQQMLRLGNASITKPSTLSADLNSEAPRRTVFIAFCLRFKAALTSRI